tara:strand:+ start:6505 stop:7998 length:1494 start_codon:yes stop_codon:yes gene_type:complete
MIEKYRENFPDQRIYEESVIEDAGLLYFMIRDQLESFLIIMSERKESIDLSYEGELNQLGSMYFLKCEKNQHNAGLLRDRFPFTKAVLIGKNNSFGLGDRLGNAGVAHLKSICKTTFRPVLAQQSIRELQRTNRTAQEVMDAASWAVFQNGFKSGFGADGDHLKTEEDIDLMAEAGYTMFTIDPSEFVVNHVMELSGDELQKEYSELPWETLSRTPDAIFEAYSDRDFLLSTGKIDGVSEIMLMRSMIKYGRVITHTKKLSDYLKNRYPNHPAELELSVDETDEPTTPFEHYLIASELDRLGVELVSLAPRFCGDFEKGIDFKGDSEQFKREYKLHLAIAEEFGGYKLSIHSGSDKFSVYKAIGSLNRGSVHVKTAGTSYLEALRTIAEADPKLFREILEYSKERFKEDKKTYHITGKPSDIPPDEKLSDDDLRDLLDDDHARQVLHVTFGSILNGREPISSGFKERLMHCLTLHEELYEKNLESHFDKHLSPFSDA